MVVTEKKIIPVAKRLDSVNEYYFSGKLREIDFMNKQGKAVINLGIGNPDLPPHPEVIKTLQEESNKPGVHGYQGYKGAPTLRKAICAWYAKWYNVHLDADKEILPLIGSKEGILHICMTYLNAGDKALIPNPGYPTYRSAIALAGGEAIEYTLKEENNWQPDFSEMKAVAADPQTKLMFVNYPHMPTGQLPTAELFQQLIDFAKENEVLIIHDNPYSFILNDNPMSILSVEGSKDVAMELNSLSKSHNMAGWRVGMLCGHEDRITEVLRFKSNSDSGMFLPVQLAAAKVLELDKAWHEQVNMIYMERKIKAYELLAALNCTFSENQAGLFIWAKIPSNYKDGFALSDEALYSSNIFVTPGGIFGSAGDEYIRVSLCSSIEIFQQALQRIKK